MERRTGSTFPRLAALAVALFSVSATADFVTSYCSTQNTGSTDDYYWQWQSNGKCTDHCNGLGTYAFAVIKYTDCWCSNYIPATQVDTSKCQVDCPGYPAEKCGDKDNGLYIYIELSGSPSGTQGSSAASSTVSSTTSLPSSTAKTSSSGTPTQATASPTVVTSAVTSDSGTAAQTVTATTPVATAHSTITSVSTTESTKASTTLKTSTKGSTTDPMTLSTVLTESGVIVTRTVIVTPTSATSGSNGDSQKSNTGAIVGGAVGGVFGILAIVGGVFFLLWRRRKQQREAQDGQGNSGITRNTSTMSKAGLLGGHGAEKDMQYPPPIITSMGPGSQRSRHDDSSSSPMTASERRYSQPVLVDSRLNPRAVLTFHGSNESRDSLTSIDDSRDYGRQLNVVNPDTNRD